jgi:prevent-host-death family protein
MDTQPHSPAKTINAGKARVNFGQLIDEVYYKGDQFIIERAGKPMAAVIPLSQFEALQKINSQPKPGFESIAGGKRQSRKRKVSDSRWVGARRVTLRHVSSRPPFSPGRAAFPASGAAPEVLLQASHRASGSIAVASIDVHPGVIPFRQPPLIVWRGNSLRVRWVLCSPLTFVLRTPPG